MPRLIFSMRKLKKNTSASGASTTPNQRVAHVTNTMGQSGDDFEKGEADGANDALAVLDTIIRALAEI